MNRRVLLLPLLVAGAAACAAVLGIEDRPLRTDAAAEAGVEAGPRDPCAHVAPDAPPDKDDAPDSIPPFYLAVRSLEFLGDRALGAGFDLDGVCTCDTRPGSPADGGSTCKAVSPDCDDDGGVDNRAAAFFQSFVDVVNIDKLTAESSEADNGQRTVLLHIADYNGTANDREVKIGIMASRGILDGSGCGTVAPDGGNNGKAPAGWCGRDRWTYLSAAVVPMTKVPIVRVKGWVRDGRLTFQSDVSISMLVAEATVSLASPIGQGKLEKGADGVWRLSDAVLAGRMPITDLLVAIGTSPGGLLPDGGRGQFCQQGVFATVKSTVCEQPDIHAARAADLQPTACDAVSTGVTFAAEQADVGEEYTPPPLDAPCAPDRVDGGLYTCP